jgi:hypothetical protein
MQQVAFEGAKQNECLEDAAEFKYELWVMSDKLTMNYEWWVISRARSASLEDAEL